MRLAYDLFALACLALGGGCFIYWLDLLARMAERAS